jgi:hypothetical protein
MSEFAATSLTFPPVRGTWQEVMSRIGAYSLEQHNPPTELPQAGYLLMVDAQQRRITRRRRIDFADQLGPEPEGVEYWRSVSLESLFDTMSSLVRFSVRQIDAGRSCVEVWFPTRIYEYLFNFDIAKKDFNPVAKGALVRMFIAVTKAIEAQGFGYRGASEDSLHGPVTIDAVRDFVEIGSRWFDKRHELQLIVAGIDAALVEDSQFVYHDADPPMYYRQSGFYIFDLLWTS